MRCLGGRDNGRIGNQGEVDARIGDQVGLKLIEIDVERAVKSERGCDGRDDCADGQSTRMERERVRTLGNESVQVLVVWPLDP